MDLTKVLDLLCGARGGFLHVLFRPGCTTKLLCSHINTFTNYNEVQVDRKLIGIG